MRRDPSVDLRRLESGAMRILREAAETRRRPVLLFSAGKDSAVMLRLAQKAFAPALPPFPLLHVDTNWKFPESCEFRDRTAEEAGMKLIVHVNREGLARGIGPFSHGAETHVRVMKTEALQGALERYGFDVMIDGARGDEERFRADSRLSDASPGRGGTTRVFPLHDWSEIDVWRYVQAENIALPALYFAAPRPVVERKGMLIVRADQRMTLADGEKPRMRKVRFRTLGCWPLTGAVESEAADVAAVLSELRRVRTPERSWRAVDRPAAEAAGKRERRT
ncbi:MAG: phosphoadenosine phosphosulfate reductase family protein [Gammaproteobacteria bacterium]|nr:phosphoadenosine phosphosulfate reductase family protein [Gammaproteobacteria bacterium]